MPMATVELAPMPQLAEARCKDDDWTGLSDKAERRRRQTRLALRALRKRKAAQRAVRLESGTEKFITHYREPGQNSQLHLASTLIIPSYVSVNGRIVPERYLYPLSRDHLLPLLEYNIYRATITNLLIIGHMHLIHENCGFHGPLTIFPNPYQGISIPPALRRTILQQTVSYPDWVDLIPSPQMRDNAIRTQHLFTNKDLASDILTGMMGQEDRKDPGMLVWSDPWDPSGWELTEGFVKKWGFLVQGCYDLFRSTNYWRNVRGERPLSLAAR
ncbi:conserved hypothetical protein [Talaromyces stipitatus ATCC 10500]|uniref:Uncharacterized protein n=1 Tax=Talaromyces stipitatus (strain ATCC 10500 / CBS 375.48 / QM 6759 / NRRL 1006) TaxID=441959 RepID=B8MND5_TALSN|nr:uncharacterized protein TSTA_102550 [Talaromyces stipitatus ATCC 10500]EED14024.1 conserved hypothetical protein [Talaromyces stipitatus ATCC 10500]